MLLGGTLVREIDSMIDAIKGTERNRESDRIEYESLSFERVTWEQCVIEQLKKKL
jgi:hypothetical protein